MLIMSLLMGLLGGEGRGWLVSQHPIEVPVFDLCYLNVWGKYLCVTRITLDCFLLFLGPVFSGFTKHKMIT